MNGNVLTSVLALIPYEMQSRMGDLELAVSGELTTCAHIDEFTRYLSDGRYSVVLVLALCRRMNGGMYGDCLPRSIHNLPFSFMH